MAALVDGLLAPIRQRVRNLEDAAGIVAREYTCWAGWADSQSISAGDFTGAATFRDGLITWPTGGPGFVWFAVPVAEGYPDYIFVDEVAMTGAWARQAGALDAVGAPWIIGASLNRLIAGVAGRRVRLEYL